MTQFPVIFRLAVTAATLSVFGASVANSQNLFNEPSTNNMPLPARQLGTLRSRYVEVDQSVMNSAFNTEAQVAGSIKVQLFPDVNITIKPSGAAHPIGEGATSVSGQVEGVRHGYATLVQRQGGVVGHVQMGRQVFTISPQGGGIHTITQEVPQQDKGDIAIPAPGSLGARPLNQPMPSAGSVIPRIRVLVLYTDRAASEASAAGKTIQDEAALAISLANSAYEATAMRPYRLHLAGARPVGCRYDETSGGYSQILYDVTDATTCIGRRASIMRDRRQADLVAVLRGNGSYCGVAWVNENPVGRDRTGFSVTSRNCISNQSFSHEVGHNLGLQHDRYVSSGTQSEFNFGFVALSDRIRTVMAYNSQCSDQGTSCSRVPVFSNIVRAGYWSGVKVGRSLRQGDAPDNRSMLRQNWHTVAGWR